jgi:hypothetical protein
MVLGTIKELKEHAELMRKFPDRGNADPNQVSVVPHDRRTGLAIHNGGTFISPARSRPFEAGMVGRLGRLLTNRRCRHRAGERAMRARLLALTSIACLLFPLAPRRRSPRQRGRDDFHR